MFGPDMQYLTRQQGSSAMADHTCILISPWEPSSQLEVQTSDAKRESDNLLFEKEELDIQVGKGSKCFLFETFKSSKDFKPSWSWSIMMPREALL